MSVDPLRDDLGVELERLVGIAPSPDLRVRIRDRVAAERGARWWPPRWQLVGTAAAVAALTIVLVVPSRESVNVPVPVVPPSNAPAISVPVLPLDKALGLNLAARPREIAPARSAARSDRPAAPKYPQLVMSPLAPLTQISIEPVAIEPLSAIAPLSGERP